MPYVVKDVLNGNYFTKDNRYPENANDRRYAHVFENENEAIEVAVQLKKKSNAQYATYLKLFGNGKWDSSWPVPKESHWRQLDANAEDAKEDSASLT